MPRRIQAGYTKYNSKVIAAIGDSLCLSQSLGPRCDLFWLSLLPSLLNTSAIGCSVLVRNWGISGQTSTEMLARVSCMAPRIGGNANPPEIADLGIFWGGTNDTTFGGTVTGGTTAKNIIDACAAMVALGYTRILVMGQHYLNYSSSFTAGTQRDTLATPYAKWSDVAGANNVSLRYWQQQAVAAAQAANPMATIVYGDLYTYIRTRITGSGISTYLGFPVTATEAEGDAAICNSDGNLHFSARGHALVADGVALMIRAQSGWTAALTR